MQKRFILIILSMLLLFILSACNDNNEGDKESDSAPIIEENNNEVEKAPPNVEQPVPKLEEVTTKLEQLVKQISEVYINAGTKYNLIEVPLTDEIYSSIAEELKSYATENAIDTILYDVAKEFCYRGCDAKYFPTPSSGMRFKMNDASNEEVTVDFIVPENMINSGTVEQATLRNVDGEWKLDSYNFSVGNNSNFTKEEAEVIAKSWGTDIEFLEEKQEAIDNGGFRTLYFFQVDQDKIVVYSDTGISYPYEE